MALKLTTPKGKIQQQNSTHVAIKTKDGFVIYSKGIIDTEDVSFNYSPTKLYTISLDREDDLFDIFERLDENNRCNVAEANQAFS